MSHTPFIPAAVRAAGEKADQLAADIGKPAEVPAEVSQAVVETPPAVVPFVDGEVQTTAPEGSADYWKHKFDATNGRYKSELARNSALQDEMKADKAEIIRLKGVVEGLQSGKGGQDVDSDDDLNDFPDELVQGVNQRIEQATAGLKEEINGLKTKAEADSRATTERFYVSLDQAAPQWETLNTDPAFTAWLQVNAKAGSTMNCATEIAQAFARQDAATVASIFNLFPTGARTPENIVPGKGPAGQLPIQETISRENDIAKFYSDVTKGLHGPPGPERQAKIAAFETRVNAAQAAGLITP